MPIPQELELLSQQLDILLGREYQALSKAFHALQTEDGQPALAKDEHRAHLAILYSLIRPDDSPLISEPIMDVVKNCLPSYHFSYENARDASIRLAMEKITATIAIVRSSHWSNRYLAIEQLDAIYKGYAAILSVGAEQVKTRVAVAILEVGYYSLDVNTARRLLCIDAQGNERRDNTTGAHAVCAANGIHYKPDPYVVVSPELAEANDADFSSMVNILPIAPGKENTVSTLIQLIAGDELAAAPSGLLSIQAVPLDRRDYPITGGTVQAGLTIQGMCFREFLFLRAAVRFFKKTIGAEGLIHLLADQKQVYAEILSLARADFPETFIEISDFNAYQLCLMSNLIADVQQGRETARNKIYISEKTSEYAYFGVDDNIRNGTLPAHIVLSDLDKKLDDIDLKKKVTAILRDKEHAARSESFRKAFEQVCKDKPLAECFEEIQDGDGRSESNRAYLFRQVYERYAQDLMPLRILLALTKNYPQIMLGQGIGSTSKLLKFLGLLFKLFPKLSPIQAINEIERVLTDYLDKKSASALWVGMLLSLPQDAKTDNFRLQLCYDEAGNLQQARIVSIDNDMSLVMPFEKIIRDEADCPSLGLTLKCSLYWLPELLEQPIHPEISTRLLNRSARSQWLTWLCLVARRNEDHAAWRRQGVVKENEANDFPVKLSKATLQFVLAQWEALQALLRENPEITHKALLARLYPAVMAAYEAIAAEVRAQRQEVSVIDCEQSLYTACERGGCYQPPFNPEAGVMNLSPEEYYLYKQGLSQVEDTASPMQEVGAFVLEALHNENWVQNPENPHWPLLQAFSLLRRSSRLDWEQGMPAEQKQILWQGWLIEAIHRGSLFMVARLLSLGANVGLAMDESLKTPLHYFCEVYIYYPDVATVEAMAEMLLTHHSCQPNVYDALGYTPLFYWANLKEPAVLGDTVTAMAKKVFTLLCAHGADINLLDGQTSRSLLDRMAKTDNTQWFIFLVSRGVRECRDMQTAVEWCHNYSSPDMVSALQHLQQHSLTWTWWLGLPQWQQKEAGRRVESVIPGSLLLPLWRAWAQSALGLPVSEAELRAENVEVTVEAAEHGRRAVKGVQYGGLRLHVKPRPEMPAVEFAIALFLHRLFGELVAPSSCLAITYEEEVHPALFSQTVPGKTLCTAMKEVNFQQGLNKRQTSAQILGAMLVHPEDGKGDNYMVMPKLSKQGEIEDYIIAIDNDHALVNAVAKGGTLLVKSILFCLEFMREPVHPVWRDRILGLSAEFFLREWFKEIENYQEKAHAIFNKDARKSLQDVGFFDFGKLPVVITIPLYEEAVIALWDRFTKLQEILRRTPTITHLALLKQLDPVLGKLYGKAFEKFPSPEKVEERFKLLCAKSYGKEGQTLSTTVEVQKAMQLPEKQQKAIATQNDALLFTPTDALKILDDLSKEALHKTVILNEFYSTGESSLFIKLKSKTLQMQIVNDLDFTRYTIAKQQKILRCIMRAKIPFTRLAIAHCSALTVGHLKEILRYSTGLAYLKLVDCPNLTNELFGILSTYDKNLIALTIVQCHGLTESKWGLIKPIFEDLEWVRIEENLNLKKISFLAPRLKRIKVNKNSALNNIIINNKDLLQRDILGRTPLLQAVARGDLKTLDSLLLDYPHIDFFQYRDNDGNTPLLLAVKANQQEMLKHLLTHYSEGITLTEEDNKGCTVIMLAKESGKEKFLWQLLTKYPELRSKDLEHSTLLLAAAHGDIDSFINLVSMDPTQMLLKARDPEGRSALLLAAENGHIAMVDYLLETYLGYFSLLQSDYKGRTAFDLSRGNGKKEMHGHLCIEYTKEHEQLENNKGIPLLHFFAASTKPYGRYWDYDIRLKGLASGRLSLWQRDTWGRTPLMVAAQNGRIEMMDYLFSKYPEQVLLSDKDYKGWTILFYAVLSCQLKTVKHLLSNYSNQVSLENEDNNGNVVLFSAIKGEKITITNCLPPGNDGSPPVSEASIITYLLSHNPEQLSFRDNEGKTPLLCVAWEGNVEIVRHILSTYPDRVSLANDKDYKGRTALMLAKENGKEEMYAYLLEKKREQYSAVKAPTPPRLSASPLAFNAAPQVSVSSNHIEAVRDEMPVAEEDEINKPVLGLSR